MALSGVGCTAAALVLTLSLVTLTVEGNYTLEILMLSYENPTHMAESLETFRHGCCELDQSTPCKPCDNAFRVCVRETPTGAIEGGCDFTEESTLIAEDDDDLMFTIGEDIGGLSNPVTVSGDMWPGRVEVLFTVYDLDLTTTIGPSSDIVDNVFIYPDVMAVSPDGPFSTPVVFTSNASYSHLELAFRLTCGENHYTSACIYCVPTNDSSGHYTCNNETGERLCLEGYSGTDCINCVPAENCSTEGGYCEEPGDCICHSGFSGDDCSEVICNCNNGSCKHESDEPFYMCECDEGYAGTYCNITDGNDTVDEDKCGFQCPEGQDCVNGSCVCLVDCPCEPKCRENEKCVEGNTCKCIEGYRHNGERCIPEPEETPDPEVTPDPETTPNPKVTPDPKTTPEPETTPEESGGGGSNVLVIAVATVGALVFILIVLVVIAIIMLLLRGRKIKGTDDGAAPNPYETPFFRKWRGNGHTSNGVAERKFENPLYNERTNSPASPPLPPRPPDHPYATLEDLNNPYAHIPGDPVCSLDEKPPHLEVPEPDPLAVANPYDHITPQSPATGGVLSASPRVENPYLSPVNSAAKPDPLPHSTSDNAMNSSTTLYAHIQ